MIFVGEHCRQYTESTANMSQYRVPAFVGERLEQLEHLHHGSITGLDKGKHIIHQTQAVEWWQWLLTPWQSPAAWVNTVRNSCGKNPRDLD